MTIHITTQATNGHLILYLMDSKENDIINIRDTGNGSTMLVPGKTYRFEWHVWSATSATYKIQATVSPENPNFPPFDWVPPDSDYTSSHQDMGGFFFKI